MTRPALPDELAERARQIAAALPPPTRDQLTATRVLLAPAFARLAARAKPSQAA